MTAGPAPNVGPAEEERAQAPIRWPRPDGVTLGLIVVYVVGLIISLAFSFTLIGVLIMLGASIVHYRREHDPSVFTLGGVSAVAVLIGGIILVATKLGGGIGQGG